MSEHPWCSDIERDLAVRAAEDAVPRPALPEWSEIPKRVAALEAAVVQLQQHDPSPASRPVEAPQTARPCGGTDPSSSRGERGEEGNGLRTERVTLEITHDGKHGPVATWPFECGSHGKGVRVVPSSEADAEIERLRRDRDEQQEFREHAESERDEARARVAELEAAAKVAETTNGSAGSNQPQGAVPVALSPSERDGLQAIINGIDTHQQGWILFSTSDAARAVRSIMSRHTVCPQPLLTAEEREAAEDAADAAEAWGNDWIATTLRALLARAGGGE